MSQRDPAFKSRPKAHVHIVGSLGHSLRLIASAQQLLQLQLRFEHTDILFSPPIRVRSAAAGGRELEVLSTCPCLAEWLCRHFVCGSDPTAIELPVGKMPAAPSPVYRFEWITTAAGNLQFKRGIEYIYIRYNIYIIYIAYIYEEVSF